jgi:hypothetical protein
VGVNIVKDKILNDYLRKRRKGRERKKNIFKDSKTGREIERDRKEKERKERKSKREEDKKRESDK